MILKINSDYFPKQHWSRRGDMFIVNIILQSVKLNNCLIRYVDPYSFFSHRPNNWCTFQWPIFQAKSANFPVFNQASNSEDIIGLYVIRRRAARVFISDVRWKRAGGFTPDNFIPGKHPLVKVGWEVGWRLRRKKNAFLPVRASNPILPSPSKLPTTTESCILSYYSMYWFIQVYAGRHFLFEKSHRDRCLFFLKDVN
jgi:hypothetical protein